VNREQTTRTANREWWNLLGNLYKERARKTPRTYSAIFKKLQLLTKNVSYVDKELLWI